MCFVIGVHPPKHPRKAIGDVSKCLYSRDTVYFMEQRTMRFMVPICCSFFLCVFERERALNISVCVYFLAGGKVERGQVVQGQIGDDDGDDEHPGTKARGEPSHSAVLEGGATLLSPFVLFSID